jgi:hypothetical protein
MVLPGLKKDGFVLTAWFKYFEDAVESQHGPRSGHDRRSSNAREHAECALSEELIRSFAQANRSRRTAARQPGTVRIAQNPFFLGAKAPQM